MAVSETLSISRVPNFASKREPKCMNCGALILEGTDLYSKRFCSMKCREKYFL